MIADDTVTTGRLDNMHSEIGKTEIMSVNDVTQKTELMEYHIESF